MIAIAADDDLLVDPSLAMVLQVPTKLTQTAPQTDFDVWSEEKPLAADQLGRRAGP